MDTGLKQRLIGAAVLVALAVIFLPMLVKGPAPDSGVSDVPLNMPDNPEGERETRELPLVMPGEVPQGGAVGMNAKPVDRAPQAAVATDPAGGGSDADVGDPDAPVASPPAAEPLPPTTAAGDYAVHFGAYASQKGADTVATLAKNAGLPAYTEATTINDKPAFRVRIGPYATRAEAEIVRVKALEVRNDVPVRVIALDAEPAPTPAAEAPKPSAPAAETKPVAATRPAEPKPAAPKPADPKPAPPKPAESKPAATAAAKPPTPKPAPAPAAARVGFAVQVGAFGDAAEAGALRERLRAAGFTAFTETVDTDKGRLTRVRVGPVLDRAAADQLKAQIQAKTGVDGIVRPHP
jgi:cell division septation protein DedD